VLGCWLRSVGSGSALRIRLAEGSRGDALVPTEAEAERAATEAARAENRRLRAELERVRRGR
jgi:hypothetical protein